MLCCYTAAGLPRAWGDGCGFCHLFHERQIRSRPWKATRVQCKRATDAINELRAADAESFREHISAPRKKVVYVSRVLKSKRTLVEGLRGIQRMPCF
mmetsp:Transcript_91101/g.257380  ORF Transcript_91101/g.257380 Transcript_91101/m.257380 type:complete len:97 (+) Transcript_91101:203-493(+)